MPYDYDLEESMELVLDHAEGKLKLIEDDCKNGTIEEYDRYKDALEQVEAVVRHHLIENKESALTKIIESCKANIADYERVLQEIEEDVGVDENDRFIFEGRAELAEQLLSSVLTN